MLSARLHVHRKHGSSSAFHSSTRVFRSRLCSRADTDIYTRTHTQLGPILIGVMLSCLAMGSILTLGSRYLALFPERRWRTRRVWVVTVVVVQLVQTGFDMARVLDVSRAGAWQSKRDESPSS